MPPPSPPSDNLEQDLTTFVQAGAGDGSQARRVQVADAVASYESGHDRSSVLGFLDDIREFLSKAVGGLTDRLRAIFGRVERENTVSPLPDAVPTETAPLAPGGAGAAMAAQASPAGPGTFDGGLHATGEPAAPDAQPPGAQNGGASPGSLDGAAGAASGGVADIPPARTGLPAADASEQPAAQQGEGLSAASVGPGRRPQPPVRPSGPMLSAVVEQLVAAYPHGNGASRERAQFWADVEANSPKVANAMLDFLANMPSLAPWLTAKELGMVLANLHQSPQVWGPVIEVLSEASLQGAPGAPLSREATLAAWTLLVNGTAQAAQETIDNALRASQAPSSQHSYLHPRPPQAAAAGGSRPGFSQQHAAHPAPAGQPSHAPRHGPGVTPAAGATVRSGPSLGG